MDQRLKTLPANYWPVKPAPHLILRIKITVCERPAAGSTGRPEPSAKFGDTNYSKEEIVAEMGASFLAGHTGIEQVTLSNSAAYLHGWIRALKGNAKLVIVAAAAAQKAFDYILNRQTETAQETVCALAA